MDSAFDFILSIQFHFVHKPFDVLFLCGRAAQFSSQDLLSYFYNQQGTPLWTSDDGGTSYATVETAQAWLQLWADMRAEGLIPDADTTYTYTEDGPDSSALVAGDAAIGLIWSNQVAAYQAATTDVLDMTTLPAGGDTASIIGAS